jgi:hypothetical protein
MFERLNTSLNAGPGISGVSAPSAEARQNRARRMEAETDHREDITHLLSRMASPGCTAIFA